MGYQERRLNRLIKELGSGGFEQRKYAAIELAYSKNPDAVPHLEAAALHDESPEIRAYAITAYGLLAGLSGIPVLVQSLDTPLNWLSSRSMDALERVLGDCGTFDDINIFERSLREGVEKLGDKADGPVKAGIDRMKERISEKRAALRSKMGGDPLGCKTCRPPKADKPSQKKMLKR